MEITKKYLINGPNNVIRLTNGEKIIYIFGDIHHTLINQTQCNYDQNISSINFDQFLIKFMKENINDDYDLFIEQSYDQLNINNYNNIYLENVRKIFSKNINFDEKNKIIKSEKYPNYRFHYFDFRNEISEFNKIIDLISKIPQFSELIENIDNIINICNNIKILINNYVKIINKNSYHKKIKNLFTKYNNEKIKKKINELLETYFNGLFYNNIINNIYELLDYIYTNYDTLKNKYISFDFKLEINIEIEKKLAIIVQDFYLFFKLTDIYLIRRILDKSYTKKNIIYTGLNHLSFITYLLVNHFDFKITNIYFFSDKNININSLNNFYKNNKHYKKDMVNLVYNSNDNDETIQCINLIDFPLNLG